MPDQSLATVMPMSEYLALKAFSSGMAHRILTASPMHAFVESPWNPKRVDDNSRASDIGTIAHDVLLEGGTGLIEVINPADYPAEKTGAIPAGWTNKAIRAARDNARAAGKIPMFPETANEVSRMVEAAKEYIATSAIAGVFDTGAPEQTITWDDDGLACKARPDWLNDDICLHLKTTASSVRPESFERMAINLGYDTSLAFYNRAAKGKQQIILAIEQDAPHACKLFSLSAAQWDISMRRVERAMNIWESCVKSGKFPAYSGEVHFIEPTSWQMAQEEQAMASSEFSEEELEHGIPL